MDHGHAQCTRNIGLLGYSLSKISQEKSTKWKLDGKQDISLAWKL